METWQDEEKSKETTPGDWWKVRLKPGHLITNKYEMNPNKERQKLSHRWAGHMARADTHTREQEACSCGWSEAQKRHVKMAGVPHAGVGTHRFHKDARSSNFTDKCTRPTAAAAYKNKKKEKHSSTSEKTTQHVVGLKKECLWNNFFCDDKALAVSAASAAYETS